MNVEDFRAQDAASPRPFSFPHEVLDDPSLNRSEKRAILCEWASDACAVKSYPTLRQLPGTTFPVTYSAVMDALAQLDRLPEFLDRSESGRPSIATVLPYRRNGKTAGVPR